MTRKRAKGIKGINFLKALKLTLLIPLVIVNPRKASKIGLCAKNAKGTTF